MVTQAGGPGPLTRRGRSGWFRPCQRAAPQRLARRRRPGPPGRRRLSQFSRRFELGATATPGRHDCDCNGDRDGPRHCHGQAGTPMLGRGPGPPAPAAAGGWARSEPAASAAADSELSHRDGHESRCSATRDSVLTLRLRLSLCQWASLVSVTVAVTP